MSADDGKRDPAFRIRHLNDKRARQWLKRCVIVGPFSPHYVARAQMRDGHDRVDSRCIWGVGTNRRSWGGGYRVYACCPDDGADCRRGRYCLVRRGSGRWLRHGYHEPRRRGSRRVLLNVGLAHAPRQCSAGQPSESYPGDGRLARPDFGSNGDPRVPHQSPFCPSSGDYPHACARCRTLPCPRGGGAAAMRIAC